MHWEAGKAERRTRRKREVMAGKDGKLRKLFIQRFSDNSSIIHNCNLYFYFVNIAVNLIRHLFNEDFKKSVKYEQKPRLDLEEICIIESFHSKI